MACRERSGFIGKERDNETGLGDFGVRKYDFLAGRFTSPDPMWEKYVSLTPYQYAGNNPVTLLDKNGKEVEAFSERLSTPAMTRAGGFLGFIGGLFEPRHTFLHVKTDKVNVLIELGGPINGSKKGNPIMTEIKNDADIVGNRKVVERALLMRPEEKARLEGKQTTQSQSDQYEFENKILENFDKIKNNLPDYNAKDGPNCNSFAVFLIDISGGLLDLPDKAFGKDNTVPYKEEYDKIPDSSPAKVKEQ